MRDGSISPPPAGHAGADPGPAEPGPTLTSDLGLYARVLDSMRDGVQVVDTEGNIVWVNQRFCELFGYAADELIGAHVSLLNAPAERSPAEVAERILAALATDGVWYGELPNLRRDGRVMWTTATVTTYAHPTLGQLSITVQGSVDARRSAEDALRRHVETLDALHRIQSRAIRHPRSWPLADLLVTLAAAVPLERGLLIEPAHVDEDDGDPRPQATDSGLRVLARLGDPSTADRLAAEAPLAHAAQAAIETGLRGEAIVGAGPHEGHWRVYPLVSAGASVGALCLCGPPRLPQGSERIVDLVASTAANLLAARQVELARRRFAAERERLAEQLRRSQTLGMMGTLASGIAHDFNNILQAISSTVELTHLDRFDPERVAEDTAEVRQLTQRGAQLVRDLLTFSRPRDAAFEPLDLGDAFDSALRILRSSLPRTIRLDTHLEALSGVSVLGNGAQLEQAIVNLGTNAADAIGDRAGHITLSGAIVQVSEGPNRTVRAMIRIDVEDDGCGMSEATLARIFEPFFTTKAPGHGTGLGLAMVRSVVEAHGGTIEVRSRPDEGSRMTLWLPGTPEGPSRAPAPTPPIPGDTRILLVDDERAIALRLAAALERLGYSVEAHLDPLAAEEALTARPQAYDLLLTDRSMPGISGEALAERARAVRPDLPVIMISGRAAELDPREAARRGITRVLEKPIDLARLTRVMAEVRARRRAPEPG